MSLAVVHYVARRFYLWPEDLMGRCRFGHISKARCIAAFLMNRKHGMSSAAIGRFLDNRDHTTILHLMDRAEWFIKDSPIIARAVSDYMEGPRLPPPVHKFQPFEHPPHPAPRARSDKRNVLRNRVEWAEFKSGVL